MENAEGDEDSVRGDDQDVVVLEEHQDPCDPIAQVQDHDINQPSAVETADLCKHYTSRQKLKFTRSALLVSPCLRRHFLISNGQAIPWWSQS